MVVPSKSVIMKDSHTFKEVRTEIIDIEVRLLIKKEYVLVNVLCRSQFVVGATWEAEKSMMSKYSHLFASNSVLC